MEQDAIYIQGFAAGLAEACRRGQVGPCGDILYTNEITLDDLEADMVDESDLAELHLALQRAADDIR
jgi:hypothetical protein